jgi:hypothetical protein
MIRALRGDDAVDLVCRSALTLGQPMFRITIRDLLWLMVVVGMGICLFQDRMHVARLHAQAERSQAQMRKLDFQHGRLQETVAKQRVALERLQAAAE